MGLISYTTITDGSTATASQVNTPLNTIYNDYNGNITNANISASAAIAFSKISGGSSTALGAWQSFTPTWTGLTVGNAVQNSRYMQIGKTVHFYVKITMGSTTSFSGNFFCTLPVAPSSNYDTTGFLETLGTCDCLDSSATASYVGWVSLLNSAGMKLQPVVAGTAGTASLTNGAQPTVPFTWAISDILMLNGIYEAA